MVINQSKNTETEQVARKYVKELFESEGYRVSKGRRGCDFIARRKDEVVPIEVKGRSNLDMNFTTMSKSELETLRGVPNARVILVYVDLKDGPRAIIHETFTKDDIDKSEVSSYRVKWKGSLRERITENLRQKVEQTKELANLHTSLP
jgi:Holliday junction resolvase-like predicted endonuclease